jgi:transcriptional regulator with XRE-family HTH domain
LRYTFSKGPIHLGREVGVPVAVREKLQAVTKDLGSQARVARALGVSPSRVSRWLRTEEPDALNRRKLEGVEFVLSRLLGLYQRDTAIKWLQGINPQLGDRRPIELLAAGRITDVLQAIDADEAESYS